MGHSSFGSLSAKGWLAASEIDRVWGSAACFDRTIKIKARSFLRLAEKRVRPTTFARSKLFDKMASNEPILFSNFAIRPRFDRGRLSTDGLLRELRAGFPNSTRARVRTSESVNYVSIPMVLDRWSKARSRFGVTDLHYIGTRFDRRIDTAGLNDFNLLPRGTDGYESQDSLVISTTGGFTDSHSDDHSGSNHSFVGTKLWLLWDTLEGFEYGLEDVERCTVYGRAAFDMEAFLAMKSSCWIFIGPGQTMFIPANLTHKVVTLEQYLGLGSFHAGLPGLLNLLSHWAKLSPSWAAPFKPGGRGSVEFLVRRALRKVRELKTESRAEQHRWGLPYMQKALRRILIDRVQDPSWTEVGHTNIKNFVIAASHI
ncbi:hypothetical protein [Bradyrhizobium sp. USDA 4520]